MAFADRSFVKVLTFRFAAALTLTASLTAASHAGTFGLESLDLQYVDLGLSGKHQVRDLLGQLDLGKSADSFQASVPRHGVVLVKISGR